MIIPMYKLSDLKEFCPLADWLLLSEDGLDILGRFYGPNMIAAQPDYAGDNEVTKAAAA